MVSVRKLLSGSLLIVQFFFLDGCRNFSASASHPQSLQRQDTKLITSFSTNNSNTSHDTLRQNDHRHTQVCILGSRESPKPCYLCRCAFNGEFNGWQCTLDESCRANKLQNPTGGGGGGLQNDEATGGSGRNSVIKFVDEICGNGFQFKLTKCKECVCDGNGLYKCKSVCTNNLGQDGNQNFQQDQGLYIPNPLEISNPDFQKPTKWDWGQVLYKENESVDKPLMKICWYGVCSRFQIHAGCKKDVTIKSTLTVISIKYANIIAVAPLGFNPVPY